MPGTRIFYVDDDHDDLFYFDAAVKKIDDKIELKTFNSSNEFLKHIHENISLKPLVFLDINMPDKNGFQVLKELKNHDELRELPVIMYSTSSDMKVIELSRELGADMYAVKPTNISELITMIRKILSIDWVNFNKQENNFLIS